MLKYSWIKNAEKIVAFAISIQMKGENTAFPTGATQNGAFE